MSSPFNSLGFVKVTTPGDLVPLSQTQLFCRGFQLQAVQPDGTANTGKVYMLNSGGARATGVGQIVMLAPGSNPWQSPDPVSGDYDLSQIFVDADTADDGVMVVAY